MDCHGTQPKTMRVPRKQQERRGIKQQNQQPRTGDCYNICFGSTMTFLSATWGG